jgi:hypothetical protein
MPATSAGMTIKALGRFNKTEAAAPICAHPA